MSFLDALIYGVRYAYASGALLTQRDSFDFKAGLTAVDNPATKRTEITAAAATVPTGTGFTHITAGAQDAASVTVNLSSATHVNAATKLPVANGGTNLSALGAALQILRTNGGAAALEYVDLDGTLLLGGAADDVLTSDGTSVVYKKLTHKNIVQGEVTIDMADADYTANATEMSVSIITNGSAVAQTADRTLFLPTSANAAALIRFIRNANAGGFNLVVQDVAAGTTVTIADGFGAWVGVHAVGAFRMGADVAN